MTLLNIPMIFTDHWAVVGLMHCVLGYSWNILWTSTISVNLEYILLIIGDNQMIAGDIPDVIKLQTSPRFQFTNRKRELVCILMTSGMSLARYGPYPLLIANYEKHLYPGLRNFTVWLREPQFKLHLLNQQKFTQSSII